MSVVLLHRMSDPPSHPSQGCNRQLLALESELAADKDCGKDEVHQGTGDLGNGVGAPLQALELAVVSELLLQSLHQHGGTWIQLVVNGRTEPDQLLSISEPRNDW